MANVQALLILCMTGDCHSQFVPTALSAMWARLGSAIRMVGFFFFRSWRILILGRHKTSDSTVQNSSNRTLSSVAACGAPVLSATVGKPLLAWHRE
jgi:hypothetical protein